jgi:hypothetical protein
MMKWKNTLALAIITLLTKLNHPIYQQQRTLFVPLSQGLYLPEQYHKETTFNGAKKIFGCFFDINATVRLSQSLNSTTMASILWPVFDSGALVFEGANIKKRLPDGLIPEYFGMGSDTHLIITPNLQIQSRILDIQFSGKKGNFWLQVNVPLEEAIYELNQTSQGTVGYTKLDGSTVELKNNPQTTDTAADASITVNGINVTPLSPIDPAPSTGPNQPTGYYSSPTAAYEGTTFISASSNSKNTAQDNDFKIIQSTKVMPTAPNTIGTVNMGQYGTISYEGVSDKFIATNYLKLTTEDVLPAQSLIKAFNGYTFGKLKERKYNKINFACNSNEKMGVADIPIQLGYNLFQDDLAHLAFYLKGIIPTGTRINESFAEYVFQPVIGNGHYWEIGGGASLHQQIIRNDFCLTLCTDGYFTRMFATDYQFRTFDMAHQPMTRYSLIYNVTKNGSLYEVGETMHALGDINTGQIQPYAYRGEYVLDCILNFGKWFDFGLGYAFSGRSSDMLETNCVKKTTTKQGMYGFAGKVSQYGYGIGPIAKSTGTGFQPEQACHTYMAGTRSVADQTPNTQFFYLGKTDKVAFVEPIENAAYTYGVPLNAILAYFTLPATQENESGLIQGQVINRVFAHCDFTREVYSRSFYGNILVAYDFGIAAYPTPLFTTVAVKLGCTF